MELNGNIVVDRNIYDNEFQVTTSNLEYNSAIDFRVIDWIQDNALFYLSQIYENSVEITLCKASKIDKNYTYLFHSDTIGKSLEVYINRKDKIKCLLNHVEGASNIEKLQIRLQYNAQGISVFHKALNRMDTKSLVQLDLIELCLALQDIVRIIHNWDYLVELKIVTCKVNGNPKDWKVNTKARFQLCSLEFVYCNINFKLTPLAKIMLPNASLRQNLSIKADRHDRRKQVKVVLKNLKY